MDDRQRLRRALLFTLIGFIVLLYLLGALSLWARNRFLMEGSPDCPVALERTMNAFADTF